MQDMQNKINWDRVFAVINTLVMFGFMSIFSFMIQYSEPIGRHVQDILIVNMGFLATILSVMGGWYLLKETEHKLRRSVAIFFILSPWFVIVYVLLYA